MSFRWAARTLVALAVPAAVAAAEVSHPVDCVPDRVTRWEAAEPDPDLRFGAANVPGIVLGPPGDSVPTQGSTSVASLGHTGFVVVEFRDLVIEDGPGADFIVFENPFFRGVVPQLPEDDYEIFAEPGFVDVSTDGQTWHRFPFDEQALDEARGQNIDKDLFERLRGLAGLTPTFTGNWTVPDDPLVWDPDGTGGISGAGGDAFDLATVGLGEARFVRITDADSQNGFPGAADGFDVDAVVVLSGRPRTGGAPDGDGDGLSDATEQHLYGSNPAAADSDGDGIDDGREVARCRDPGSLDESPWWLEQPRLWLDDAECTEVRWSFLGTDRLFEVIRGHLANLMNTGASIDLGPVDCLADDVASVRWSCDSETPLDGEGFFYLVRPSGETDYGLSSDLLPRETSGDCP